LLTNPTTIASTAQVSSISDGVAGVSGPSGTTWTLTNLGSVADTGGGYEIGISFAASGTIINAGGISAETSITKTTGVYLGHGGSVTNQSSGLINGYFGIAASSAAASVVNAGRITGNITSSAGAGIYLQAGGAVTNQSGGTIGGCVGIGAGGAASTVVNAGGIAGAGYTDTVSPGSGVYLGAGGLISNQSGGTITGYVGVDARNTAATVVNAGLIAGNDTARNAGGVYLRAGGSVTNQPAGTISGFTGVRISCGLGTVNNLGLIATHYSYPSADGVYLVDGGSVTNGAPGGTVSAAYIRGYRFGVQFGSSTDGTLTNFGTINGKPGDPAVSMATGTIINGPSGATGALIEGGGQSNAVLISGAATIINYATIVGVENPGDTRIYYGVSLGGAAGSISNLGANSLIENYLAVYAAMNDTVTNAGTIATNYAGGAYALVFGGGTNRLIVDPGARFIGTVSGGGAVTLAPSGNITVIGTANGVGTTTMELASAASAGTLASFGSSITNFTSLEFDPGAQWTVAGNAFASGLGTIGIGGFTFGDTIDLTGFIATGRTFASNSLVLTDGGGAHVTLAIQSTLATGNFAIASDGGGGTDIFPRPLLFYAETLDQAGIVATTETVAAGVMTLRDPGGTAVGTINVGTSLSTGDFSLTPDGTDGTDVIVHRATGTYANGLTLVVNPTTIASSATVSGTATSAVGVTGSVGTAWTVANYGQVSETGASGLGFSLASTSTITNAALGLISGAAFGIQLGQGGSVTNRSGGTITGATGVNLIGTVAGVVINAGIIVGNVTTGSGVSLSAGGSVTNQAGGTISGSYGIGAGAVAATVVNAGSLGDGTSLATGAGVVLQNGGVVTNQSGGMIVAGLRGIYGAGAAVTLVNAGTIGGNTTSGNGITFAAGGQVINQSGGVIDGKYGVRMSGAAGTVTNAGSIGGNLTVAGSRGIALTSGGSVTNQSGGTITGLKAVAITGGVLVNAGSIGGNGTTTTGAGVQLSAQLSGGSSVTNQAGGTITGFFGVYGKTSAVTVANAGSIGGNVTSGTGISLALGGTVINQLGGTISGGLNAARFNAGFTNLVVSAPGAVFGGTVDGGNTIGATSVSTLELALGDSSGTLTGLGTQFINFAETTIDSKAQWTLAGANSLAAGATLSNLGMLTATGTLFNSGTVTGNRLNLSGGSLTNQASGLLTVDSVYGNGPSGTNSVANLGTIINSLGDAINLTTGGTVSNAAGALISGLNQGVKLQGTGAALSNLGRIVSVNGGGYGANLRDGGLVTNGQAGPGSSTAVISGATGLVFNEVTVGDGPSTLVNFGTVQGTDSSQSGVQLNVDGTIFNGQSGATAALIQGGGNGIYATTQGTVVNYATITGVAGVFIFDSGVVSNLGQAALIEGWYGVLIGNNGTVINSGTISSDLGTSGIAVSFGGGAARLIDDPGAVFIGRILGGTGGTAVMELASGSSVGTISGFGDSVTNFTSLVFDPGAVWSVAGDNSPGGLGSLGISGFAVGDTIDLTGFAAISRTFASDALVLTDIGGAHETLNIEGTLSTADFVIADDNAGGTDITVQARLVYGQTIDAAGIVVTSETVAAGVLTLRNGGSTVGTIVVGPSLSTGDFMLMPDGAGGTDVIVSSVFGTYSGGVTLVTNPTTITSSARISDTGTSAIGVTGPAGTAWALTNLGQITETGTSSYGIDLLSSGTITNAASGTIAGYAAGIVLSGGGSVTNQFGGTIAGGVAISAVGVGTVVNSGLIGTPGSSGSAGVALAAGGSVANQPGGTIAGRVAIVAADSATVVNAGSATIGGVLFGIALPEGGSVTNQTGGVITGYLPVYGIGAALTVVNAGSIGGFSYFGVALGGGGLVSNQMGGAIGGLDGIIGVSVAATVINAGVIYGNTSFSQPTSIVFATDGFASTRTGGAMSHFSGNTDSGAYGTTIAAMDVNTDGGGLPFGVGVVLLAGGSVTNQSFGTIGGGVDAVLFAAGYTNRMAIEPAAEFIGIVDGGNTIGATSVSTLELTSSDGPGTLTGLGTQFINFAQTTIDAGARWTLSGTNSLAAGATLSNAGTLTDNGTIISSGSVTGSGTIVVDGGDTFLALGGVDVAESVSFGATSGTIGIAAPAVFAATVLGLPINRNTFDFTTIANGASLAVGLDSGHHLTVTSGGTVLASIQLDGSKNFGGLAFGHVSDGNGGTDVVLAAPPVIGKTASGQSTTDEQVISPFSNVTITDPTPSQTATVTIMLSDPANGVLSNLTGGSFNSGTYTVSGSTGAVGTAIEGLVFTPTAHQVAPGGSTTTTFTIMVTNALGITSTDGTTTVGAIAVNDPPVIAGGKAGQIVDDTATISPFSGVTINDPDFAASETLTITLTAGGLASDANGALSDAGLSQTGVGTYTLAAGTPLAVTSALEALVFTPTNGEVAPGKTVTTGMTLSVTDGFVLSPVTDTATSVITTAVGIITTFTIASAADLTADLLAIDAGGVDASADTAYTFEFISAFAIASTQSIDLPGGGSVTFIGGNATTGGGYDIAAGALIAGDVGAIGSGAFTVDPGGILNINGFNQTIGDLSGAGAIALNGAALTAGTADTTTFSGDISGDGALIKQGGGQLTLAGGGGFSGGITIAAGTLALNAAGAAGTGPITFGPAVGDVLAFTSAGAPISNTIAAMVSGQTIDLLGQTVTATDLINTNTLQISLLNGGSIDLTLDPLGSYAGDFFHFTQNASDSFVTENTTPCYLAGTAIRTDRGEVPVETLAIGDRVITLDGSVKPIKWIGRRNYSGVIAAGNRDVVPILITTGALADNVPVRDLYVSPLHAIFLNNVLIPAEHLLNGVSIRRCPELDPIRYFHIELDQHEVIFAEGAPAETFVDCDSRAMFHNARDFAAQYPGDSAPRWVFRAPRVVSGPILEDTRRAIEARAGLEAAIRDQSLGQLRGWLDGFNGTSITGWAFDPGRPAVPVTLEVLDGEGLIARITANRYRSDLETAGFGDGRHGFELRLARGLSPSTSHCIHVRRAADRAELPGSPVLLEARAHDVSHAEARLAIEAATQTAPDAEAMDALLATLLEGVDHARQVRADWGSSVSETVTRPLGPPPLKKPARRKARAPVLLAWPEGAKTQAPRVLVIDDTLPRPDRDAGSNAVLGHMIALRALGWRVEFVASRQLAPAEAAVRALEASGVTCHRAPFVSSVEEVLRRHRDQFAAVYLHRLLNAEAYAGLVRAWQPRARVIYSVADLHHVRLARQASVHADLELMAKSRTVRQRELAAMRLCDVVITHSTAEAALLAREAPGAAVHVVPWAPLMRGPMKPGIGRHRAVAFIGGYRHAPNADAARWLVTEIMPLVWARHPNTACLIVGGDWPADLSWLLDERVRLTGQLNSLEGLFGSVLATVAPMRFGAGLKGKVMESLAAGVPCVMTSVAAEGFPLTGRLPELVADDADGFAEVICRLHEDAASRRAFAEAGLAMIGEYFSVGMVERVMAVCLPGRRHGPSSSSRLAVGVE
jgi:glycosyltransferase involved in cell wall biosynthesis